jgi:predicted nucleic acid-binding protein
MAVAVDTNILLDILLPDPVFKDGSLELLTASAQTERLIISEVVYAELATQFPGEKLIAQFIKDTDIHLVNTPPEALWIAAGAWKAYLKNRDSILQCSRCGKKVSAKCGGCGAVIAVKQHIIPDFLIGGHAMVTAGKLLTRDRGFYRLYFSGLEIAGSDVVCNREKATGPRLTSN